MKKLIFALLFGIAISANSQSQPDTVMVSFFVKDTTNKDTTTYAIMDAYGDTITTERSNDWIQVVPGFIINGEYVNIFFEPLDKKFLVLNIAALTPRKYEE